MATAPSPRLRQTARVQREDGTSLAIREGGLLVGRADDCDLVLEDQRASLLQVLLLPTARGVELIPLGRNPTRINDRAAEKRTVLSHGDVIGLPGADLTVSIPSLPTEVRSAWMLSLPDGPRFGVRHLPFTVGGQGDDDLCLPGWPPGAFTLYPAQGALAIEAAVHLLLNDEDLPAGSVEVLDADDTVAWQDRSVVFSRAEEPQGNSTVMKAMAVLPTRVAFEFLPSGGRLEVRFGDQKMVAELAELRARLVATLLSPPGQYQPGDFIPDEVVIKSIWAGQPGRGRTDLNVLIHRTRKDLLTAGINPAAVLARARKGGATSFRLAKDAAVSVE